MQLALILFGITVLTKLIPSFSKSLTADACIYLDIGRNIFSGHGFTTSYNLYQFWAGQTRFPALPLFPPMFPLLAGLIWKLTYSVQATIFLNVVIAGLNCVLLFYILNMVYNRSEVSFWSVFLVSISLPMQQTSMFAWSEQSAFLCVLMAVYMLLKDPEPENSRLIKTGLMLGIGFLVRIDIIFILPAFLVFILFNYGFNLKAIGRFGYILSGILIILLP